MNAFADYVYEKFTQEIQSWASNIAHDIYVIVIYVAFVDDDTRAAELWLNYNTVSHWRSRIPDASSEAEAKWNSAFWFHDAKLVLCKQPYMNDWSTDFDGVDWRGVGFRDAYLTFRWPRTSADTVKAILDVCANVTQRLHENGVVASFCGCSVPIVFEFVNDIGNDDYRWEQIHRANAQELTQDYENWA